jgi:peptidyl-tRNA hydrolase
MSSEYVMYCIFSAEAIKAMGGNRGKLASMAGHAYLHAWWDADDRALDPVWLEPDVSRDYRDSGLAKKVTLVIDTTERLTALYDELKELPYGHTLVVDRGLTVFEQPTTVCIGFGPVSKYQVPEVIKNIKVLI